MTNSSHKTSDRLNKLTAAHRLASVHPFTDAGSNLCDYFICLSNSVLYKFKTYYTYQFTFSIPMPLTKLHAQNFN